MISQYGRIAATKQDVNVRRVNKITLARKLRLASFVSAPRLIKGYHNNPRLIK
jgi:hypothetical protein